MEFPAEAHAGRAGAPLDIDYINDAMVFIPSERCTISCGTVCVDPRASKVLIIFNRRLGIWQLPKGRKNIGEDLQSAALRETYEETGVRASLLAMKIHTRATMPNGGGIYDMKTAPRSHNAVSHQTTPSTASASSASTAHSTSASVAPASIKPAVSSVLTPSFTPASPEKAPVIRSLAESRGCGHGQEHKNITIAAKGAEELAGGYTTATVTETATSTAKATVDSKVTCDILNNEPVGIVQYPDLQAATPNTMKTVFFFAASADSTAAMGLGAQEDHEDLQAEWMDFRVADQRLRFGPEKEAMWKVRRDMERSGLKC